MINDLDYDQKKLGMYLPSFPTILMLVREIINPITHDL